MLLNKEVINLQQRWQHAGRLSPLSTLFLTLVLGLALASCVQAQGGAPNQGDATPWTGPNFGEFSGVNQAGSGAGLLLGDALTWNRFDLSWGAVEPQKGVWKQEALDKWGQQVLDMQAHGMRLLPVLDYTADWAADRGARQYSHGDSTWKVMPREDGQFDLQHFQKQADVSNKLVETKIDDGKSLSKWPPADSADWEQYVRKVVTFLHQPPYNVEYFQIWNEAHPTSGFWSGGMDEYMEKVHLPAARVIHQLGGKVVYGGWPDIAGINNFPTYLDQYKAWDSIDVLDFHYYAVGDMEYMRKAADERGYKDLAIWQSEIAFTRDYGYIGNTYPRALYWALGSNWDRKDKYKLFFFPYWSPNDSKAYGYGRALLYGSELSPHGQSLQNVFKLLQGPNLHRFTGITTTPELNYKPSDKESSLECFAVENRIVVAVHLDKATYDKTATIILRFPIASKRVATIERVDLSGTRLDLTPQMAVQGTDSLVQVPVKEADGAPARQWNENGEHTRTFYVVLTQKTP